METFQQTLTKMSQRSHSDPLKIIQGYHLFPESFVSVRFVFLRHYLTGRTQLTCRLHTTQPGDSECTTLSCIPHLHSRMECSTYVVPRDWGSDFGTTY